MRIIILEDDNDTRAQLELFLKDEPFDFTYCSTAACATICYLKAWEEDNPFQAAIVDVSMKRKNGFKFIEQVRSWEDPEDTPMRFRVMTAYDDLVGKSDLLVKFNVEGMWHKPKDLLELKEKELIKVWLGV